MSNTTVSLVGVELHEYQESHVFAYLRAKWIEEHWLTMSRVVDRLDREFDAEHGPWAAFAGFERALLDACPTLDDIWHELDGGQQGELYAFVCTLLREERAACSTPRP